MGDKNRKTANEAAYAYLASRMRTTHEVEKHLREKGYAEDEITDAVNELIGMRYLDDYQYALRYYEYNREKRRGSGRAARELAEKGVDSETIRNAREDFLYSEKVDEFEDALEAAEREIRLRMPDRITEEDLSDADTADADEVTGAFIFDDKEAARIARKLEGRGFDRGDIFRVLETLRSRYAAPDRWRS